TGYQTWRRGYNAARRRRLAWPMAPVWSTGLRATASRVQIPPPPQDVGFIVVPFRVPSAFGGDFCEGSEVDGEARCRSMAQRLRGGLEELRPKSDHGVVRRGRAIPVSPVRRSHTR